MMGDYLVTYHMVIKSDSLGSARARTRALETYFVDQYDDISSARTIGLVCTDPPPVYNGDVVKEGSPMSTAATEIEIDEDEYVTPVYRFDELTRDAQEQALAEIRSRTDYMGERVDDVRKVLIEFARDHCGYLITDTEWGIEFAPNGDWIAANLKVVGTPLDDCGRELEASNWFVGHYETLLNNELAYQNTFAFARFYQNRFDTFFDAEGLIVDAEGNPN